MNMNVSLSKEELLDRIDLQTLKPSLKNKEMTVSEVLGLMLSGLSAEEIMLNHPELDREDVLAALYYAKELTDSKAFGDN